MGTLLVLWCPAMLMADRIPRLSFGGRFADGCAGLVGGMMSGLGGFSGPAPTLWCTLRGFEKSVQRAVIQNFNLAMLSVTMGTYLARGIATRDMLPMFAVVAPAMLVPTVLGTRLYAGMSEVAFKRTVLGLLTASGMAIPRGVGAAPAGADGVGLRAPPASMQPPAAHTRSRCVAAGPASPPR